MPSADNVYAEDTARFRVLSLGAGVQSTAVMLLAERGDIPPFDLIIFADTGDEPADVYDHLDRLDPTERRSPKPPAKPDEPRWEQHDCG